MLTFTQIGNYGRFGNQLFQYASVYGIAKRRGFDFSIPVNNTCTLSKVFEGIRETDDLQKMSNLRETFSEPQRAATVFLPEAFHVSDNTDFYGYFQSPKYFSHCESDLKRDLKIKSEFLHVADSFVQDNKIDSFIHVRRGDYAIIDNGNCHPPVTLHYLKKAIQLSEGKRFVVISDDIPWCRANLDFANLLFSPFSDKHFGYDFAIMARCDSAIISNSTFSWWGAWLGKNERVIAPSVWFGSNPVVPDRWTDVYCDGWKII